MWALSRMFSAVNIKVMFLAKSFPTVCTSIVTAFHFNNIFIIIIFTASRVKALPFMFFHMLFQKYLTFEHFTTQATKYWAFGVSQSLTRQIPSHVACIMGI
ncbi:hypothetical protein EGW08_004220 [Elysia chlorotica]|uniref:Uncharacterized protein n=1 Tax=Elysia chlorotica TaxID=188477 RepID=A0A433U2K5_ELYCH|nr:hypothetical protein EGW08_004220 [Elysia chlorotica]